MRSSPIVPGWQSSVGERTRRPVRSLPPSKPSPARHRPGARSARRDRSPWPSQGRPLSGRRRTMWFSAILGGLPSGGSRPRPASCRLSVEPLEERCLLSNGTWSEVARTQARAWHTAALLGDGRVLVAGGFFSVSGTPTNTARTYDPDANSWDQVAAMRRPRMGHTATLLDDGRVLVTGGWSAGQPWS